MKKSIFVCLTILLLGSACTSRQQVLWDDSFAELSAYRAELDSLRSEFRACEMPDVPFFLFGMGNRTKYLYRKGELVESLTGKVVKQWAVEEELIIPSLYRVLLKTSDGGFVALEEDGEAFWLSEGNSPREQIPGTSAPLNLPLFSEHRYGRALRVLHHEILINIVDGMPLPNYFVYRNGWRRDGAMMAMCLEQTGNVELIRSWVLGLTDPYDRNNAGETEADNLGQTLYLLSLFTDKEHPLAVKTLEEVSKYLCQGELGVYIQGRSDFHEVPAYQTKFLNWGLSKLGLPDVYDIPQVQDNYSALFWWDYKDTYMPGTIDAYDSWQNDKYPYIGWAADHFHDLKRNPVSNRDYPLTWEIEASQADYTGMALIDEIYVKQQNSSPHTWHAAEVFLYLLEMK